MPLKRLYDQVIDRFLRWRMLRWCTRLAKLDLADFEEAVSKTLRDTEAIHIEGMAACASSLTHDLQLAAVIAELPEQQRILLHLLKQGATYQQIGATLGMSNACALRALTTLLCELANRTSIPVDAAPPH